MIPITKLIKSLEAYFWNKKTNNTAEGSIYASKSGVYDIGSPSKPFRNIYANNIIGSPGSSSGLTRITGSDTNGGFLDDKLTVSGILTKSTVGTTNQTLNLTVDTSTLLLRSGANSLTGNLSVAAGVTIDGVDISAHAADPDAHHEEATGGNGITVSGTQAISVRLATDPALEFSGLDLRVKAGASITRNSSGVNVNLAHNYTWTGDHIFQTDTKIAGNLIFQGANKKLTTESNNNLWLDPHGTGHIMLPEFSKSIVTDGAISGFLGKGWQLTNDSGGHSHLDIRSIYAEELHVTAFIADTARVQVGETFLANSMALVASSEDVPGWDGFAVPAISSSAKIYVEDVPDIVGQMFANNDWVMLRFINREPAAAWVTATEYFFGERVSRGGLFYACILEHTSGASTEPGVGGSWATYWKQIASGTSLTVATVWGQVTIYNEEATIDGVQSYTFTTRRGPNGLKALPGSLVIGFGQSGDSYIHTSVIANDAPWQRMMTWAGSDPYTPANRTLLVQTGNLSGIVDSALNPTGHGLYATNVFLKGKLRTVNTVVDENGLSLTHDATASSSALSIDGFKLIRGLDDTIHGGVFGHTNTNPIPIHSLDLVSGASPATQSGYHRIRIAAAADGAYSSMITLFASTNMPSTGITILADAGLTPTRRVEIDANLIELISGTGTADIRAHHLSPTADNTYDLGTNTRYWKDLYVKNIIADTITGSVALGGQVWQYDTGDMRIRSNAAVARTLFIENQDASNVMNLNVEGSIVVGGNVDGVNISGLSSSFDVHVADVNAHHARSHDLDSVSDHTGTLSWSKVSKTGSNLSDLATRAHSSLTGSASGDDHTQYVHTSSARTIVARHTFNPPTANSPFILGANAQGQLVTGLYADQLSKQVISGNGLTGGGALTADRTLHVGAGNGITANADDVAVNLTYAFAWTEQHTWNTGISEPPFILNAVNQGQTVVGLRADQLNKSVIAGAGLINGGALTANVTLNVGAGNGISVAADTVAVNQAYAFTWTAQHAFNPGSAAAPFTLNANAQSQLVIGLRADQLNKQVIAGAGLINGGTLTANVTLNIGAGDGITVNADSIEINEAFAFLWTAQHTFNMGSAQPPLILNANAQGQTVVGFRADQLNKTITAGDGLTGGGILTADRTVTLGTPTTLNIGTTNSVTTTSHAHEITTTSNAQTTPSTILAADASGYLLLNRLTTPTITSSTYVELTPTGNVIIDPTGNQMIPGGSVRVDVGAYNRKWARLYAEELIVTHLVQRQVTATLGGSITVNATTSLIADMTDVQTTIDVKDNILVSGMFIRLNTLAASGIHQAEAMQVTSGATVIAGGFRFTVTRALTPYTGKVWSTGDAVISLGTAVGSGWIELVSEETSLGQDGPNITVFNRTATTNWNSVAPVVSVGNLKGLVDYAGDKFGIALGNDLTLTPSTGFSGVTSDSTDGIRLFNVNQEWYTGADRVLAIDALSGLQMRANIGSTGNGISWNRNSSIDTGGTYYATIFPNQRDGATASSFPHDFNIMFESSGNVRPSLLYISARNPDLTGSFYSGILMQASKGTLAANSSSMFIGSPDAGGGEVWFGTTGADPVNFGVRGNVVIGGGINALGASGSISLTQASAPLEIMATSGNHTLRMFTELNALPSGVGAYLATTGGGGSGIYARFGALMISSRNANTVSSEIHMLTGQATRLSILNDGNVGIGTITPLSPLQVNGAIAARTDSAWGYVQLVPGQINNIGYIAWHKPDTTRIGYMGWGNDHLRIQLENSAHLVVLNGRLGVNQSAPAATLHVEPIAASGATLRLGRLSGSPSIQSTEAWLIMDSGANPAALNYYSSSHVVLAYGGGNVGIGFTGPTSRLHVNGTMRGTGLTFGGSTMTAYTESTWTVAVTRSTTNPTTLTYTHRDGRYTRIGNTVFFSIDLQIGSISGGSGDYRISLPITSEASSYDISASYRVDSSSLPSTSTGTAMIGGSSAYLDGVTAFENGTRYRIAGHYYV